MSISNFKKVISLINGLLSAIFPNGTLNVTPQVSANDVSYIPPGEGAVPRTLQQVAEQIINVADYGAVGDDKTDCTKAIQDAIDYAASINGGTVVFSTGTFVVTDTITITKSNITLQGAGGDIFHDNIGTNAYIGTQLRWGGASDTTKAILYIATPQDKTNGKFTNMNVRSIRFNCANLCGYGLHIKSISNSTFEGLFVINALTACYFVTAWAANTLAEPTDVQNCLFNRCTWRTLSVKSVQTHGFWLTSDTPQEVPRGNVSFNSFYYCVGQFSGDAGSGYGVFCEDADNNIFVALRMYRARGTDVPGVYINGRISDSNHFYNFSLTGPNSIKIATGPGGPADRCTFIALDTNNGTALPDCDYKCTYTSLTDKGDLFAKSMVLRNDATITGLLTLNYEDRTYVFPNTRGEKNQVLTSDGQGQVLWKTVGDLGVFNSVIMSTPFVPTASTDPGQTGQLAYDSTFFYWYTGARWNRIARDASTW